MNLKELCIKYPSILLDPDILEKYKLCCAWVDSYTNMVCVYHNSKSCKLHRLILDAPPEYQVDHIDMNRLNNLRSNLRLATRSSQQFNVPLKSTNTSGHRGVNFHKPSGLWRARLTRDKKEFVDFFKTKEEAIAGRAKLEELYLKDIHNHGTPNKR